MVEQAKALLNILIKRGFEAFFIGGKCRNDLHNQYHETKVFIKDIDIVTNATVDDLKKMFPNSNIRGESFQVIAVVFGGLEFEIATYRRDIYNITKNKKGKIEKPETVIAKTLDEDRERRDFTINAIAQKIDGTHVDYVYNYRNKKISAIADIKNKIIRAIGNPKQRFEEDPLRILRAFRFMSQLGYEIEKNTIVAIASNLKLLEFVPHERIAMEMNKLIMGNFAYATLTLMREMEFFKLNIKNSIDGIQTFLPYFSDIEDEHLQKLTLLNLGKDHKLNSLETWAFLFQPLGIQKAKENLNSFHPLSNDETEKVEWLIENYNLVKSDNIKIAIYNARTGIVKRHKIACMKELLISLAKIHSKLTKEKNLEKKLLDIFCSRPYFEEQLAVNGEQLMEIAQKPAGPWITQVKDRIIFNILNMDRYPREQEKYDEIVKLSIEEILVEDKIV